MKKLIILATLLLGMAHAAFAEKRGVLMEIHYRSVPGKNMSVNRAPMRLPIEVVYDSDTHKIKVTGNESMDAEVFQYNANGDLANYSSSLNTEFTVLTPGIYIIQIQGDGWYAEGEVEME